MTEQSKEYAISEENNFLSLTSVSLILSSFTCLLTALLPYIYSLFYPPFTHLSASTFHLLCHLKVKNTNSGCFRLSFSVLSLMSLSLPSLHPHCCPLLAASFKVLTLGGRWKLSLSVSLLCLDRKSVV